MRIYDLARELEVANKELMTALQAMGVAFKSHSSSIDDEAVAKIREKFSKRAPKPQITEPPAGPKVKTAVPAPQVIPAPRAAVTPPVVGAAQVKTGVAHPAEIKAGAKPPLPKAAHADGRSHVQVFPKKPDIKPPEAKKTEESAQKKTLIFYGPIIVRELAERMGMKPNQLIAELMMMNVFAAINERLEIKAVQQVAEKHGFIIEHEKKAAEVKVLPDAGDQDDQHREQAGQEHLELREQVLQRLEHYFQKFHHFAPPRFQLVVR